MGYIHLLLLSRLCVAYLNIPAQLCSLDLELVARFAALVASRMLDRGDGLKQGNRHRSKEGQGQKGVSICWLAVELMNEVRMYLEVGKFYQRLRQHYHLLGCHHRFLFTLGQHVGTIVCSPWRFPTTLEQHERRGLGR